MSEQTPPGPTGDDQDGRDPGGDGPEGAPGGGVQPGPDAGEQMARKVVQDVSAFEVDPPPPARVRDAGGDERTPSRETARE